MLRGSKYSRSLLGKVLDLAILAAFASGGRTEHSGSKRARLIEANEEAQRFFMSQIMSKEALAARKLLGGAAQLAREIVIAVLEQAAGSLRGEHAGWSSLWRNTMSLIIWSGRGSADMLRMP